MQASSFACCRSASSNGWVAWKRLRSIFESSRATNCDLKELVQQGKFREDLYYRLNVVPLSLPSLAERIEDLPSLVRHLLTKICRQEGLSLMRMAPETVVRLMEYHWPGNVRQLEMRSRRRLP